MQAPLGSDCGAADLGATGPTAATIPGAPVELFDIDRVPQGDVAIGSEQPEQPDATINLEQASVGKETVPDTGVVAKPMSDDLAFPTACVFSFDVATNADVGRAYLFSIGSVYFPVPAIMRADLEAASWVANIGVNPQ